MSGSRLPVTDDETALLLSVVGLDEPLVALAIKTASSKSPPVAPPAISASFLPGNGAFERRVA